MRGNSWGKMLTLTSFGESHGAAMGAVLDGVPAGLPFCLEDLQKELDRRAPGKHPGTSTRREEDRAEVLSGIFENKTLGSPIALIVRNRDARSEDYDALKSTYRPGHGDKTWLQKFGIRDHRGGGRASGRETLSRVIGGYFAHLIIPEVSVEAWANRIGPFQLPQDIPPPNPEEDWGPYGFPSREDQEKLEEHLMQLKKEGESCGGSISILVKQCPPGLGEPCFDKLKADLAKSLLSIGACVSCSFGEGERMATKTGTEVSPHREAFGGIEGGISNGDNILMRATFKPPSTIGDKARCGRHDPCIIPRVLPVAKAMVRLTLADHFLRQRAYLRT